jgi:hypothetical protein
MLGQLRQPPCTINEIEELIVDEQIALGCLRAAVERALVEHENAAETIAALKAREGVDSGTKRNGLSKADLDVSAKLPE